MTRVVLVRHGETEWNRVERFRGQADVPLNERGVGQAEATAAAIAARWRPAAVYSSPLSRARRTAEAIAGRTSGTAQVDVGLSDIDYGEWQGLSPDEVRGRWPGQLSAWYLTPDRAEIPGGESLSTRRARSAAAIREIVARHPEETVVAVGHTVINRIILLFILGLPNDRFWHLRQDTCAINVIEAEGGDFTLVSMNDTCHLRTDQP